MKLNYIPIDFIKGRLIGLDPDSFLNNDSFILTPVLKHGDQIQYYEIEVDNMNLKIMPEGKMILQGSLHKFYNNGAHNYNQFSWQMFKQSLIKLRLVFGINPYNIWVNQLEWGVNISPLCETKSLLRNLFQHKKKDFHPVIQGKHGDYHQVEHYNYYIKIYDKSKQYKQKEPILRLEIKQKNWTEFREIF